MAEEIIICPNVQDRDLDVIDGYKISDQAIFLAKGRNV